MDKVELAGELTPLPDAPTFVEGAIDWRGQMLPVLSMRRRLHLQAKSIQISDKLIIVHSSRRRFALLVDAVAGVFPWLKDEYADAGEFPDGVGCIASAVKSKEGIILIHDLEMYLSEDDENILGKT